MKHTLETLVKELAEVGLIVHPREKAEGVWTCEYHKFDQEIAKYASQVAGGLFQVHKAGIYWSYTGSGGWIMPEKNWEDLERSQAICLALTGSIGGWTHGANAGAIVKWALEKDKPQKSCHALMNGLKFGYHECLPCVRLDMGLIDMSGCYYQLVDRLKSVRFHALNDGTLLNDPLSREEKSKWHYAKQAMKEHKVLRNSVWGKMLGSVGGGFYFSKGERKRSGSYPGSHQTAGYLVARMAWELCHLGAIETDAVYAQTDGLIVPRGSYPTIWNETGMKWRLDRSGPTHVIGQHRYSVGGLGTKIYDSLDPFVTPAPRPATPDRLYIREYLMG